MNIKKAIETLKMENELMQFNPMTGEIEPIELQNQDNQDLYKANLVAISALEKLAEYKDLEEQGLLIKLPCKIGDTVYIIHEVVKCPPFIEPIKFKVSLYDLLNKSVFLTREEAEKALEVENE
ncbi:MAG: hypothetical protein ACOX7O_09985 [Oscillospiraceae bacterium]|jgi:hypothetical protein